MKNKGLLRFIAAALCAAMIISGLTYPDRVFAEQAYVFDGNMVTNSSFDGNDGWTFDGAGYASNNGHYGSGDRHFYLDANGSMSQNVVVPYTGFYTVSVWAANAGQGARMMVVNTSNGTMTNVEINQDTSYKEYTGEIMLTKGCTAMIRVIGGNSWVNGDDISLVYNESKYANMILQPNFSIPTAWTWSKSIVLPMGHARIEEAGISQEIYIPQDGPYYFEAELQDNKGCTMYIDDTAAVIASGASVGVVKADSLTKGSCVTIKIEGSTDVLNTTFMYDLSSIVNEAPVASDVVISGAPLAGQTVEASYTFSDPDGNSEGNSTYKWYIADSADGEYTQIEYQTAKLLNIRSDFEDKFIKFGVVPEDQYALAGEESFSEPIGPVDVNLISNAGFEANGNYWSGISISNRNAYAGLCRGIVNSDDEASQSSSVPDSNYYDLSCYVKYTGTANDGKIVVESEDGDEVAIIPIEGTGEWQKISADHIALEGGTRATLRLCGASDASYDIDEILFIKERGVEAPKFTRLSNFYTGPSPYYTEIDRKDHVINVFYGEHYDLSNIVFTGLVITEGNTASIAPGTAMDLTKDYTFTVTDENEEVTTWTVHAKQRKEKVALTSSNETLQETFNWAAHKVDQFVMTGVQNGRINIPQASGQYADYIPSYWAGYYDRTAFYSRDFVHQATGAEIAGLEDENFSMFKSFARECTKARKWYTAWALNFDGSIYTMDYYGTNSFVREVPAQFELVEKAYKQYLWSGDSRYIEDPVLWNFYTHVMTDYIELHDANGNGVAQEVGTGIFDGSCTYNERGRRVIEAGDAIGSQYQATLAYAGMLKARGENEASEEWYAKAAELKRYFNEEWSVSSVMDSGYVCAWGPSGERYSDFSKETSWFIPMKLITEPGERNTRYIDFILQNLGNGIGTTSNAPTNIEAYTYIPDMLFAYNRSDDAWKWMKYIASVKDNPHERATQGTNGDYPEISFTFVSSTIEGMMGVNPNAAEGIVSTVPRLPKEVHDAAATNINIGKYVIELAHDGNNASTFTNRSEDADVTWEACFYGNYPGISINGKKQAASHRMLNGEEISFVSVNVKKGETVKAETVDKMDEPYVVYVPDAPVTGEKKTEDKAAPVEKEQKKIEWVAEKEPEVSFDPVNVPKFENAVSFSVKNIADMPENAKLKVSVVNDENSDVKPGQKKYLYKLDEKSGKLLCVANPTYIVDEDGYVTLNINSDAKYVLLDKPASKEDKISIYKQISVESKSSVKKGKTVKVQLSLPDSVEPVEKLNKSLKNKAALEATISYSTSDKKIATVSKDGSLKAKAKGTVTVTVTVRFNNGVTKKYKSKVTVK